MKTKTIDFHLFWETAKAYLVHPRDDVYAFQKVWIRKSDCVEVERFQKDLTARIRLTLPDRYFPEEKGIEPAHATKSQK